MQLSNFDDFCNALLECGFSMGGGNSKGIFSIIDYSWENQDGIDSPVKWHTGEPDTDPWEWRMRVLEQRDDIAYSKLFFRTSGYITKQWYPYFMAVRRNGEDFQQAYLNGTVSAFAKRIYDIISENGDTPLHEIKLAGSFKKEDGSAFERAMTELQMRMFITMSGRAQKRNRYGELYGWSSTVFCTTEDFWLRRGTDIETLAAATEPSQAYNNIEERIKLLNPSASDRNIRRFICG